MDPEIEMDNIDQPTLISPIRIPSLDRLDLPHPPLSTAYHSPNTASKITLAQVLSEAGPEGYSLKEYRDYLTGLMCQENLDFLQDVKEFTKQQESKPKFNLFGNQEKETKKSLLRIADLYISERAAREINLPFKIKNDLLANIETDQIEGCFGDSAIHIENLLLSTFSAFVTQAEKNISERAAERSRDSIKSHQAQGSITYSKSDRSTSSETTSQAKKVMPSGRVAVARPKPPSSSSPRF